MSKETQLELWYEQSGALGNTNPEGFYGFTITNTERVATFTALKTDAFDTVEELAVGVAEVYQRARAETLKGPVPNPRYRLWDVQLSDAQFHMEVNGEYQVPYSIDPVPQKAPRVADFSKENFTLRRPLSTTEKETLVSKVLEALNSKVSAK